ncbi:MAG: hypothetical protein ABIG39_06130 [Candidatus Micrarchaeota archaeon]
MRQCVPILLICMIAVGFSQPTIDYMQLVPQLMSDDADTDCQAIITYDGDEDVLVSYWIWDLGSSQTYPMYSGTIGCIGVDWASGKICHTDYFAPEQLSGVVTCLFQVSAGEVTISKTVVAARECKENCPPDCGNGVCGDDESSLNCAQECLQYRLETEVLAPGVNDRIRRGEVVGLKVSLKTKGTPLIGAEVVAGGFFGEELLLDDGMQGAGDSGEGAYGGSMLVPNDANGINMIEFQINGNESTDIQYVNVFVVPRLELEVSVGGPYSLGGIVTLHVEYPAVQEGARGYGVLEMYSPSGALAYSENTSFERGEVSFSYHTTLVDEVGTWDVGLSIVDEFENSGEWNGTFELHDVEPGSFLTLEHLGPKVGAYVRGTTVSVTVRVTKEGNPVSGADVTFFTPGGNGLWMKEVGKGVYGSPYTIKWGDGVGVWRITTQASEETDSERIGGTTFADVSITPAELDITILNPNRGEFAIGETLGILTRIEYPNGELANASKSKVTIGGRDIPMTEVSVGMYRVYYRIEEGSADELVFSVDAEDMYANTASKRFVVRVTGTSMMYYVEQYMYIGVFILIAGIVWGWIFVKQSRRQSGKGQLLKRKMELLALQKKLQERYLKEGSVNRKTFYEMTNEYGSELEEIDRKLEEVDNDG